MKSARQKLEEEFLKLPNLQHVGMALLQYVISIGQDHVTESEGVFHLPFVSFSFPGGSERIRMFVDLDLKEASKLHERFLPVERDVNGYFCDIVRPGQLSAAIGYVDLANAKYGATRKTSSTPMDPRSNN